MSVRTHTAVLSVQSATGKWRLFVGLLNTTASWPEHVFTAPEIPTPTARTAALALLGYEPVAGAQWEWSEDTAAPDGPADLLASLTVREQTGGAR
ncbi:MULTISPECIES: DUF6303 family protein [Streptomyces phaeochromogenes group]|uniref:DUF6303 family protein n=1 Tax=Streptomyces phaeochromogenes group TaxID=2838332 RepID=UPI0016762F91|nr:DUF6303 family protein [Streptomyces umbrinus]WSW14813.1 DUF6303 family protein [Streptomyces phaeochromogenes]GHB22767.1 hypothetical protein GCM10010306_014410 [Streptomyces umbrinus]